MKKFNACHVIPTGVGARIGGFVGDAVPATNLLASICDNLIVNPNAVNGVALNLMAINCQYVEGFFLDRFFLKEIALRQQDANKIGVIIDNCGNKKAMNHAINTIEALRTNEGINVVGIEFTKKPVNGIAEKTKVGSFVGKIPKAEIYLEKAMDLKEKGATAIAIATYIKANDSDLKLYFKGKAPNPFGGLEAIISHSISMKTGLPAAHAPLVTEREIKHFMLHGLVDPRAAAEAMGPAYLGCVLQGLHKAPQAIAYRKATEGDLTFDDLNALIVPADSLGGIPMMACEIAGKPIIGVKENKTILNVGNDKLNFRNFVGAENYLEAAGMLSCLKKGISFESVRRPFKKVRLIR